MWLTRHQARIVLLDTVLTLALKKEQDHFLIALNEDPLTSMNNKKWKMKTTSFMH